MGTLADLLTHGNALAMQGRFREAAACYQQLLQLQPNHAEARNNLGVMYAEQRQFAGALAYYDEALTLNPQYADAHYNKGNALRALERLSEAADAYENALRLRPGFAAAHLNRGIALAGLGRTLDAVAEYQLALRLQPRYVEAHSNLGLALAHLGRHVEALACYQRALELRPDFADAHYNRSLTWLAQANFAQGWPEYEWRWRLPESPPRPVPQPLWDGTPLAGQSILLHSEQGLGDTIQFIRFAPLVQARGGKVVVECQPALVPLLRGCPGIDVLVGRGDALPAFAVHCPLMSLPRIFNAGVEPSPAEIPYLQSDPARVERWRREIAGLSLIKIGIAWQGSAGYRWDRLRSIPLAQFAPLAQVPGVRLISLQKGPGVEQIQEVDFEVVDLRDKLDSDAAFVDTAALMQSLDLVITSDTAAAHLAGALGRPVWAALSLAPEWRWLLERSDSPWYPTMRLFRQRLFGVWADVFERITNELRELTTGEPGA
jgi:Flp pilus assembly protein TadD